MVTFLRSSVLRVGGRNLMIPIEFRNLHHPMKYNGTLVVGGDYVEVVDVHVARYK
jgi:hypothetical protein